MTAHNYWEVVRDQFVHRTYARWYRRVKWSQFMLLLVPVCAVITFLAISVSTVAVGPVLTATSIITGLTFTMAMRFWEKRIEITSAPQTAGFVERKDLIIENGTHLIWTVIIGVCSTAWSAFAALVSGDHLAPWATAVCAALLSYQLALVVMALLKMYVASIELG